MTPGCLMLVAIPADVSLSSHACQDSAGAEGPQRALPASFHPRPELGTGAPL